MLDSRTDLLRCPNAPCRGRLAVTDVAGSAELNLRHGLLACRRCHTRYPYLMGIPIVVARPNEYVATHQETILATLAAHDEADSLALDLVRRLATQAPLRPVRALADTSVPGEHQHDWPLPPPTAAFAGHAFQAFLSEAEGHRPEEVLATFLRQCRKRRPELVVDAGCSSGVAARAVRAVAGEVLLTDDSFRAVAMARDTLANAGFPGSPALVCDPAALPLRPRSADAVLASHLLDRLDSPHPFLATARSIVRQRGVLLLSTANPALGGDHDALGDAIANAGFDVQRRHTVPWLRAHSARHYEVFFSEVLAARPG